MRLQAPLKMKILCGAEREREGETGSESERKSGRQTVAIAGHLELTLTR